MATELNARVGRSLPLPAFGWAEVPASTPPAHPSHWRVALPPVTWPAAALLAALWPHWVYIARRSVDGSDEPWGVLALATVIALLARDRGSLLMPPRGALVAGALLAVAAGAAHLFAPDLVAAAVAMLALGVFVVHALPDRPATPLLALLLLTLPIIASLQFYLGYPLRVLAATAAAGLLSLSGVAAHAAGASIVHDHITVLIDAPCAGIGMLWVGSYAAALLSYLQRANAARTLANGVVAGVLVLAANVLRNTVLFFPEAGLVQWPAWTHEAVGLAAFVGALFPLIVFVHARLR